MIFTTEEIRERILPIMKRNRVRKAVLFGSYSKGTATEKSDIDLMVDSRLKGLDFVGLIEEIRECLNDKEVDVIDVSQITPNSPVAIEIHRTGVEVYAG